MNQCPQSLTISVFVDGELSPGEEVHFKEHLQTCSVCNHELERLQALRSTLSSLTSDSAAKEEILNAVLAKPLMPAWWKRRIQVSQAWAASFLLVLLLSLAANIYLAVFPTRRQTAGPNGGTVVEPTRIVVERSDAPTFRFSATGFRLKEKPVIHLGEPARN